MIYKNKDLTYTPTPDIVGDKSFLMALCKKHNATYEELTEYPMTCRDIFCSMIEGNRFQYLAPKNKRSHRWIDIYDEDVRLAIYTDFDELPEKLEVLNKLEESIGFKPTIMEIVETESKIIVRDMIDDNCGMLENDKVAVLTYDKKWFTNQPTLSLYLLLIRTIVNYEGQIRRPTTLLNKALPSSKIIFFLENWDKIHSDINLNEFGIDMRKKIVDVDDTDNYAKIYVDKSLTMASQVYGYGISRFLTMADSPKKYPGTYLSELVSSFRTLYEQHLDLIANNRINGGGCMNIKSFDGKIDSTMDLQHVFNIPIYFVFCNVQYDNDNPVELEEISNIYVCRDLLGRALTYLKIKEFYNDPIVGESISVDNGIVHLSIGLKSHEHLLDNLLNLKVLNELEDRMGLKRTTCFTIDNGCWSGYDNWYPDKDCKRVVLQLDPLWFTNPISLSLLTGTIRIIVMNPTFTEFNSEHLLCGLEYGDDGEIANCDCHDEESSHLAHSLIKILNLYIDNFQILNNSSENNVLGINFDTYTWYNNILRHCTKPTLYTACNGDIGIVHLCKSVYYERDRGDNFHYQLINNLIQLRKELKNV